MKRRLVLLGMFLCAGAILNAQVTSDFSLTANPTVNIPLGPSLSDGTPFYSVGAGVSIKGEYSLPFAQLVYTGLVFDADYVPINSSPKALTLLSLGPEVGVQYYPVPRLGLRLAGYGGYYAGMVQAGTVINPFAGALFDVSYLLSSSLSLGAGASFKYYFTSTTAVYQGIGVNIGIQYHFVGGSGGYLHVEPQVLPIFPLFYSYYDKNPAGSMTIKNTAAGSVQDVTVSFMVKQFMDEPKVSWHWKEMGKGEERTVPIFALFTDAILQVTEATKVAGDIAVTFKYLGNEVTNHYPVTVTINNRNGMTWDDTDKAAAFVTANDPIIRSFSARTVPDARSRGRPAINAVFRSAVALFNAMNVHGVAYLPAPTAYADKVSNKTVVDHLQFPAQTLELKAGDCSDISILFAALLESAGIEAAYITVPGHIFVAFNMQMDPQSARSTFANPDDLIIRGDETWIPVEITQVKDSFLKAWHTGAQEWRAASADKTVDFRPIRKAWATYAPANTGDRLKVAVSLPDQEKIYSSYSGELGKLFSTDFQPRIAKLQTDLKKNKDDVKLVNKLGVLYARFGMLDEAKKQFDLVIKTKGDSTPTLINLGNLAYLDGKNKDALDYYTRALAKSPQSSTALQGIAMAGYELGETDAVQNAIAQLKQGDPNAVNRLAAQGIVAGGVGGKRAASAGKELDTWSEE